jgi:hypothetical protein
MSDLTEYMFEPVRQGVGPDIQMRQRTRQQCADFGGFRSDSDGNADWATLSPEG